MIETTCFRVTAHLISRTSGRDIHSELVRLEEAPKARSYAEVGLVLGTLFGLALFAASFGWLGLALYFAVILLVYR